MPLASLSERTPEERSLALLEAAPIAVVVVDDRGTIEFVNRRAEELFLYRREEMIGQPLEMLLPDRLRGVHEKHRDHYFEALHPRPMGLGLDLAGRRGDGTEFPVEVGLSHVRVGEETLAVSFITDITLRIEAAEAMRRHATELEARVLERTAELDRRRQVADGLSDVLRILNTARPLDEILHHIARQASRLLHTDAVAIYRQQDDEEALKLEVLARSEQTIADSDTNADDKTESVTGPQLGDFESVLTVPLNVKGEVYGTLSLYDMQSRPFTSEEKELAIAFADQAALAVENARLREQIEESAVLAERNRLARDLHDAVTQTLFAASLIAEVIPRLWETDREEAQRRLAELGSLTRGALAEMRTLLLELRPAALVQASLPDLLSQLVEAVGNRAQLSISARVFGEREPLPDEVKIAYYRIAQEALNNVARHAGASQAQVELHFSPAELQLRVEDDGKGFRAGTAGGTHLGLNIMRERSESIGAELRIESSPGAGTRIGVLWRQMPPPRPSL